ncbi:PepSY domain-containing protein [Nannocystaceae bacterium ST9]
MAFDTFKHPHVRALLVLATLGSSGLGCDTTPKQDDEAEGSTGGESTGGESTGGESTGGESTGGESTTGEPMGVEGCIAANEPEDTHGFESDNQDECPQPFDGGDEPCPPITPESIAEQCADEGHPCDPDAILSRDAALCIAEFHELAPGLLEWRASLVYNYEHNRPIWAVENTLAADDCVQSGVELEIDAQTGELLGTYEWTASC